MGHSAATALSTPGRRTLGLGRKYGFSGEDRVTDKTATKCLKRASEFIG